MCIRDRPEAAREALAALAPVGAVNNLLLDYYPQREGAERLQFAANLQKAVSYTHLDVYKRQISACCCCSGGAGYKGGR